MLNTRREKIDMKMHVKYKNDKANQFTNAVNTYWLPDIVDRDRPICVYSIRKTLIFNQFQYNYDRHCKSNLQEKTNQV